ncbi:MAG TPA: hypothetical protein DDW52_22360 [Planctomycetaceae bacterium]|nr:hypothetical protein [Planctomycetaceae bacterium]
MNLTFTHHVRLTLPALCALGAILASPTQVYAQVTPDAFDAPRKMQFPDDHWHHASPESQGFSSDGVKRALAYLKLHCKADGLSELLIIRNGVVIWEGDNTTKVHNIWSCSKSFTSTALGLLIEEGKCKLDTKAATILPVLSQHYPDVTLRHFATMTSGYSAKGRSRWNDENSDWSWTPFEPEEPLYPAGQAYAYWDEAMIMFGRTLTRIAGQNLRHYLEEKVFEPCGMGKVQWDTEGEIDGHKICYGATGVKINARQLAKFGHLYLNEGRWADRQVLPSKWVRQATRVQVPESIPVADTDRSNVKGAGAYGYNWWVNGGLTPLPHAPPRTYYASGLNHNVCVVVPEWNLVVVRMGVDGNPEFGKNNVYNEFLYWMDRARLIQRDDD